MKRFQPYQVAQTLWTQLRSSPTNDGTASTPSEAGRATYRVQARNSLVTVLPEDVLVLIFRLLDPQDLIICQMVCADMARYIRNDVISQYHIELAINGMVDGPPGGPSMEERLRLLRDYVLRLRRGAEAITKLRRSVGSNSKSFVRADCSVHWTYKQGNSEIEILSAPALGASQVVSRTVITVPRLVHVEAVDLSQGLLVVSDEFILTGPGNLHIHLLSIDTGITHPDVSKPSVALTIEPGTKADIQIRGNFIAWSLFTWGSFVVEVRDWRRADQLIWRNRFTSMNEFSYTLLDDELILCNSQGGEHISVFRYASSDSEAEASMTDNSDPVLILDIPIGIYANTVYGNTRSNTIPGAPFHPDRSTEVFTITLWVFPLSLSARPLPSSVIALIPLKTIYDCLSRARDRDRRPRFSWHDWAPYRGLALDLTNVVFDPYLPPRPFGCRLPLVVRDSGNKLLGYTVVVDLNPVFAESAERGVLRKRGDGVEMLNINLGGLMCSPPLRANAPYVAARGPRTLLFGIRQKLLDCNGPVLTF